MAYAQESAVLYPHLLEKQMISPARRVCYSLLGQIGSGRIFSDDALNSDSMERLEVRDRHLTTEVVYGTLRWQGILDFLLARESKRLWQDVDENAKILLRMSLYQMWRMDRIPDHALVNDAVELAKRELGRGIDRYVNGILRQLSRQRPWIQNRFLEEAPPWVQISLPRWIWERWSARFGPDIARDFALSMNLPPRAAAQFLGRSNGLNNITEAFTPSEMVPGAYTLISDSPADRETDPDWLHYQDEASQLIPHLLGPNPGARVWDACAAPGGKTFILSRNCRGSGHIVASDLSAKRISRLAELVKKMDMDNVHLLTADASISPPFVDCFDAVLADVPCSGLGTIRRNPEIKWHFHPSEFNALRQTQVKILSSVSAAVRVGGRLLYATCSTEPEENEQTVEAFLAENDGFRLMPPTHPARIGPWTGRDFMVRTYPSTRLWDGFFAALMVRNS